MKCGTTSLAQRLFDEYGTAAASNWSILSAGASALRFARTGGPRSAERGAAAAVDGGAEWPPRARKKRRVVHGGEAGARTKKKLKIDAAALATLDELLDAVRSELPPPKGRRADLGRVRVTIEDAEGGTIEVEDDDDMADAADARCVHVRGWPL